MNINKPITIVIIDTGIDETKSDLKLFITKKTGYRINDEGYIIEDKNMQNINIHGTLIALIIRQFCKNIDIININILNENLNTDMRVLLVALEKALLFRPNIIHLSLGTKRLIHSFSLRKIIDKAKKNNIIIVAAANNDRSKSYPAYQRGVIGVKGLHTNNINEFK